MIIDFSKPISLEDDAVLLRPLEQDDVEKLLWYSTNEPETWQYSLVNVAGRENLEKYIADAIEGRKQQKEYPFIVYDKLQRCYAGSTRFYAINAAQKTLLLGYTWYGKKFRGTGLNKHCKLLMLDHAFEAFGAERVEFRADNRNRTSIAAMQSIGCTVEGILRSDSITADGGRRDSIVLSILKQEWEQILREKLRAKIYAGTAR